MTKKESFTTIHSLDNLRGIASFMVAFFHFSAGNRIFLDEDNILRVIGRFGWSGVEIFFIISGFVIPFALYILSLSCHMQFHLLAEDIPLLV